MNYNYKINCLLFDLFLGPVWSQTNNSLIYASQNPIPVGSNITLFSTSSVTNGVWLLNSSIIVIIFPGNSLIPDKWKSRITFNTTTSSLSIGSLTMNDSGVYALDAVNSFNAQLTLSVQGKDHFIAFHVYSFSPMHSCTTNAY